MTHKIEFLVSVAIDPVAIVVQPLLVKSGGHSSVATPDLAKARKIARDLADFLGCDIIDTCEEPAE